MHSRIKVREIKNNPPESPFFKGGIKGGLKSEIMFPILTLGVRIY
jgi:hypothetical protein